MRERPILFNGDMVRAILRGQKTQTRRSMREQVCEPGIVRMAGPGHCEIVNEHGVRIPGFRCPYGQPGDRLWVRETWAYGIHAMASKRDEDGPFVYKADGTTQGRLCERWRPSIHMPRSASRITLEITGVRVERLQACNEVDAIAEGAPWAACGSPQEGSHKAGFAQLWESINGAGSWPANPWVWAVEFRPI